MRHDRVAVHVCMFLFGPQVQLLAACCCDLSLSGILCLVQHWIIKFVIEHTLSFISHSFKHNLAVR